VMRRLAAEQKVSESRKAIIVFMIQEDSRMA